MPLETARQKMQSAPDMLLPPPFTLVRLRELGDAFAHAISIAGEQGAGTLVYVGRFDLAEFAVVLEPEEPLARARRAFHAGMVALADALISSAQPETAITITWPDAISVNQGLVGGGRLAWPHGTAEDEVPEWLVFGAMIRTVAMTETEAGVHPLASALQEEGFGEIGAVEVTESFARHLMVAFDRWQVDGFSSLAHQYLTLVERQPQTSRRIEANGDFVVQQIGGEKAAPFNLAQALAKPSWLDPDSGGPRL
jgi:biotin-(acetyl-CoA carboxylase) ligase